VKKIFRKNQVIITTLAFLIAIAGYISYDHANSNQEEDAQQANADAIEENYIVDNSTYDIYDEIEDTETMEEITGEVQTVEEAVTGQEENGEQIAAENAIDEEEEEILNPGESVLTSTTITSADYAATVKLNREQVRSKNQESLSSIINNETISEEQKQLAIDQMVQMTDIAQKEADAEMLLEAKGFSNVVVSISDDTCDVVLDMGDVTDAKRAQVEDIVKRKTGVEAENIIITPIHTESDQSTN
jgi:stage III sporulation protein AH